MARMTRPARSREKRRDTSNESSDTQAQEHTSSRGGLIALGIFALIVVGGPLAFGAVDRLPQIALLGLLIIGILVQPPAVVPLSLWGKRLAIAFVAILLFKEFAPAGWFGETSWRTALTREFALEMPFTHHPEPGRAVERLFAAAAGAIWFLWVRRLAAERANRPVLAWTLLVAAAIVAGVSFATRHPNSDAIYGLRFTPGWIGFGPFPNRNHSGDFFAMAAVLGCGCITWAAMRKRWTLFGVGAALVGLIVMALLTTESRGGLLAFAAGLGAYLVLCLLKVRSRRALGVALATILVFGALTLAFGSRVFARIHSAEAGDVSSLTRLHVWQDALGMWRDAPLFGHGAGAFASIFPLYQTIELENQIVFHPESSWLLWLTELGALPVLLAVAAGVVFLAGHLRESFSRHRGFFLRAGGFAAAAVLLVHAFFDVPAHRWGTAGFALAALAIACPMRLTARRVREPRQLALVPLAVAVMWALPLFWDVPGWSPTALVHLISRHSVPPGVSLAELEAGLRRFPLNADLHQSVGLQLLRLHGREAPATWQRHFAIVARLVPSAWELTSEQARAVQRISTMMALPYWQQSVARGGIHREDILGAAWNATSSSPAARAAWGRYAEANPHLLLNFARLIPETQAGYYYGRWWKTRAAAPDLGQGEIRDFYVLAARWGRPEQLDEWMTRHPKWEARDFRAWAGLLHQWGDDARAWKILASHVAEPGFPAKVPTIPLTQLETTWHARPQNFVNAQQLAHVRNASGDSAGRDEVILSVATAADAPQWFAERAAHLLGKQGRTAEAVALLVRSR
jgi:O-antigen ligase